MMLAALPESAKRSIKSSEINRAARQIAATKQSGLFTTNYWIEPSNHCQIQRNYTARHLACPIPIFNTMTAHQTPIAPLVTLIYQA